MTDREAEGILMHGEKISPSWTITWINPGHIEAGESIAPAKLNSDLARKLAALYLVIEDLQFAFNCFVEADKLGLPDGPWSFR
jgi:hypothetical protein